MTPTTRSSSTSASTGFTGRSSHRGIGCALTAPDGLCPRAMQRGAQAAARPVLRLDIRQLRLVAPAGVAYPTAVTGYVKRPSMTPISTEIWRPDMTRFIHRPARPFRATRSAIEEHEAHLPTPFVGCPECARRPRMTPLQIGWVASPIVLQPQA